MSRKTGRLLIVQFPTETIMTVGMHQCRDISGIEWGSVVCVGAVVSVFQGLIGVSVVYCMDVKDNTTPVAVGQEGETQGPQSRSEFPS